MKTLIGRFMEISWRRGNGACYACLIISLLAAIMLVLHMECSNIMYASAVASTRSDMIADSAALYAQSYDYKYNKAQAETMATLLTAYNNGTYYAHSGESWREFSALYDWLYATYSARFAQPLMITEFSCAAMGGDKRAWTEEMFQKLRTYDRIKVAVWWDHVDYDPAYPPYTVIARDYRIEPVLDLFKECHKTAF